MATPKAPKGGFQHGGWYEGMQYDAGSGTFGAKGVEHIGANAGKAVSEEVNRASSIAQGKAPDAIQKYIGGSSTQQPATKENVQSYLDSFQQNVFSAQSATNSPIKSDAQMISDIRTNLQPTMAKPEPLNRVALFEKLRADGDVGSLETNLVDLKDQEEMILQRMEARKAKEEDEAVPLDVISGRTSEIERQERQTLDFIGRQKTRVAEELQMRYGVINTMIQLTGLDYQDAVNSYNQEFQQNIAVYNAFRDEKKEQTRQAERVEDRQYDIAKTMATWQREDSARAEDAARSNLQIYSNLIASGKINYASMPAEAKAQITKLEVQSGLGVGFISKIQKESGGSGSSIKSTTTRTDPNGMKYADVLMQDSTGKLSVQSYQLGAEYTDLKPEAQYNIGSKEMANELKTQANDYGHVAPEFYQYAKQQWVSQGGPFTSEKFDETYVDFRDPYRAPQDYGIRDASSEKENKQVSPY